MVSPFRELDRMHTSPNMAHFKEIVVTLIQSWPVKYKVEFDGTMIKCFHDASSFCMSDALD